MDRWVAFFRRQMQDQILVTFQDWAPQPEETWPPTPKTPDEAWGKRPSLSETNMKEIMEGSRQSALANAHLPDDRLPSAYPTAYFGEGIASALLGGKIHIVGNMQHTCSGSEPLIKEWEDLKELRLDKTSHWAQRYQAALRRAAELDSDGACFSFTLSLWIL